MKNKLVVLGDTIVVFMFMALLLTLPTIVVIHFVKGPTMSRTLIYNTNYKIVSIQSPEPWRSGKFSGVDKRWLLQSINDTNYYFEWHPSSDSLYFSSLVGDTVHFDYVNFNRFFKIRPR